MVWEMTTKKSAFIDKPLVLYAFSKHDLDITSLVALVLFLFLLQSVKTIIKYYLVTFQEVHSDQQR